MQKYKLPSWLRFPARATSHITTISAILVAVASIYTAYVVKQTAEIAKGEFALARRPAVFLTDLRAELNVNSERGNARLSLYGVLREVREIPTTVHEVRVGHYYANWELSSEARWRNTPWRDVPLYGEHLVRPMLLERVDVTKVVFRNTESGDMAINTTFNLSVKIEYTLSIQDGPREKWTASVSVKCTADRTCTTSEPPTPEIESVPNNSTQMPSAAS